MIVTKPEEISLLLRTSSYSYINEHELHHAIGDQIRDQMNLDVQREVRLNAGDRIDLVVLLEDGRHLGIEVKIRGGVGAVWDQLQRYANEPKIDELMIVTTQRRHLINLPEKMTGKPVHTVLLRSAS